MNGPASPAFLRGAILTLLIILLSPVPWSRAAASFRLPTANQALFEPDGGPAFFVGTVGKPWTSGAFGCVRSEGGQFHEGLDIRSIQKDRSGEPTDPVRATADGTVAYVSEKAALSNYGKYIILRHEIEGMSVCSLYAHLASASPGLKIGQVVKAGDAIATMGRTSNTRQAISKDRAHVHFEINVLVNERFPEWYRRTFPDQRNDHGVWNGQNLLGMDPAALLTAQRASGIRFSLASWLNSRTALCRVLVRTPDISWVRRHRPLVIDNPKARQEGIAGYELALAYNGLPIQAIPRAASEINGRARFQLLSVNEEEQRRFPCRKLVTKRTGHWELAGNGQRLLELLAF